jgi:hypothetical protein
MWFCLGRKLVTCDLIAQVKICKVLKKKMVFFDSNELVCVLDRFEKTSDDWSV